MPSTGVSPYVVAGSPINFVESHGDLGITIDKSLKFHSYIKKRVNTVGALTTNLLSSTLCREKNFLINVYTTHIRPQLEYGSSLWNLGYVTDLRLLERIQRRWTRTVAGLQDLSYDERLRSLNLFSVKGRLLRADLIYLWKMFNGQCAVAANTIFTPALSRRTRGHQFKIQVEQVRLDVRKRFFTHRVVNDWNNLSQDTVATSSLSTFKGLLHRELGERL